MDNCDQKGSHTTVEYLEIEHEDTSNLSTTAMDPEETLQLFNIDLLLLNGEGLKDEREHLERIILTETGKALAHAKPEQLGHWLKVLPLHHPHPFDHLPLREASIMLRPPHYFQVGTKFIQTTNSRTWIFRAAKGRVKKRGKFCFFTKPPLTPHPPGLVFFPEKN